jgi:protein TonB
MTCKVTAEGTLTQCVITEETPAGLGFGQASLALVPKFRMKPKTDAGEPVEGATVVVVVDWNPR